MTIGRFRAIATAVAISLLVAGTASADARGPSYSARYARDRAEIEDLMARYLFALDYADMDAYVATFTKDGELEFASGTAKGHAAIRRTVEAFRKRTSEIYKDKAGNPAILRHVLLQTAIRVEKGRAWATAQWLEMANDGPEGAPKLGTFGIYEDELRRVNGRWLFSKRRVLNDFLKGRHSGPRNPVGEMDDVLKAVLITKATLPSL